ncbi:PREDICTED: uncharacterized protein LOC109175683 isoform X2 [Ipomoea nil]|uniref:uncharacterized protein LOC109175683 isoform X2 n=1 Tax=Ipomoea nil TaxID=35883 RepID=UPI000901B8E7|nr:PREDICTED: uncharacterized protein LOC109175683 isoform X2 [Ipomoea nil]
MGYHHLPQEHHHHQLPMEEITSPLSTAQLLEFCESELFPETAVQISEVGSSSNCCYEEHSSHSTGLSAHTQDMSKFTGGAEKNDEIATNAAAVGINEPANGGGAANNNNNLSVFFDPQEDDISRTIDFIPDDVDFSIPPQFLLDGQFDFSLLNGQGPVPGGQYPPEQLIPPPLPQQPYEEECLPSVPSYMPSCSILDPTTIGNYLPAENSGIFTGAAMFQPQELDFQVDNGRLFCPDTISRAYNFSNDLQAVSSESQHLSTSTPLASEITSLEDSTFKVGKLSVEQRKEKIHRYLKKRNERNFSKKIKYACRKTLADSRPRVRGRFAKNDERGGGGHGTPEEETITEDVRMSLLYDPNQAAALQQAHNGGGGGGGRIFAANCLPPPANPYEMCTTTLYCTDSQMRSR